MEFGIFPDAVCQFPEKCELVVGIVDVSQCVCQLPKFMIGILNFPQCVFIRFPMKNTFTNGILDAPYVVCQIPEKTDLLLDFGNFPYVFYRFPGKPKKASGFFMAFL